MCVTLDVITNVILLIDEPTPTSPSEFFMPTQILMPALSPTMEEGKLARWLVKEGEQIKSGKVIAEIETDKATMEVEAVDDGVVARLLVPQGTEKVRVNTPIAILLVDGEAAPAPAASPAASQSAPTGPKRGQRTPAAARGGNPSRRPPYRSAAKARFPPAPAPDR